ncbi:hypothetical protein REPUB_Repub01dG0159400 [Reevesia pubescens]
MDLNKNVKFSHVSELGQNENFGDTTLRLNFLGYGGGNKVRFGSTQSNLHADLSSAPDDGCRLVLGLGPTPSVHCDNYYNVGLNKSKSTTAFFTQGLSPEDNSILKLGLSGGTKESMSMLECSLSTQTDVSMPLLNQVSAEDSRLPIPVVDEGSTSAKKSGGYMPSLLLAPRMDSGKALVQTQEFFQFGAKSHCHQYNQSCEPSQTDFSVDTLSEQTTTMTSSDNRTSNSKKCKFGGCSKGARGASGLCIGHGGGQRCQKPGCNKGAESRTAYCKAHGGGKRCIFAGCTKGAEGSTPLCKGHGGGKRCLYNGGGICPKSVHGGTNFCVAHGGGKRCVVPGCTKSARGRTDCCVRHGGGKRCKFENCGKSAQGSTDFCKAHGGGKRCSWGDGRCEKFARGRSGLCAAHNSMVQEREASKGGLIAPGVFHGLVSAAPTTGSNFDNNHSSSGTSVVSDCIDSLDRTAKRQQLIPPQVLVPLSMKSSSSYSSFMSAEKQEVGRSGYGMGIGGNVGEKSFDFLIPEGRVHGGGLMSLLGGNLKNPIDGI